MINQGRLLTGEVHAERIATHLPASNVALSQYWTRMRGRYENNNNDSMYASRSKEMNLIQKNASWEALGRR